LVEETMASSSHANFPGEKKNGQRVFLRHHEDWGSYSRHVFALIFHILYYDVLSVAWYATLNSLFYAAEEIKYWLVQSFKAFCGNVINGVRGENVQCSNSSGRLLACWRHRIWHIIGSKTMNTHHNQPSPPFSENMSSYHHQEEVFIPLTNPHDHQSTNNPACFIRLPAARNTQFHLPRGAIPPARSAFNSIIFEGLSIDEAINQFGAQLPPQSLAVKLIAEGINSWGRDILASASAPLVHLLATGWRSDNKRNSNDKIPSSELILPPATGMLLVGPEGVGKLHLSRSVAHVLLDHCAAFDQNELLNHQRHREDFPSCSDYSRGITCSGTTLQSIATVGSSLDGVLEILAEDYAHLANNDIIDQGDEDERSSRVRRRIVEHIRIRESLGSVIIIQHIENFPISLLSDITKVLSGKSYTLSYNTSEGTVEATCNGVLFLFTSRKWGSRSIFRQIQMKDGITGLHREHLISSVRREVNSHTDMQFSNHFSIIAPLLPLQRQDINSLLISKFDQLDRTLRGTQWKRLEISNDAINLFVDEDHVEYFDLFRKDTTNSDKKSDKALLTFSVSGAMTLDQNSWWKALSNKIVDGTRRRPNDVAFIDIDEESHETVFCWMDDNDVSDHCKEEWRLLI